MLPGNTNRTLLQLEIQIAVHHIILGTKFTHFVQDNFQYLFMTFLQ